MEDIRYLKFLPTEENADVTDQLIECFGTVFSESPWHEWLKCPVCGKYWGKKDAALLDSMGRKHCGASLAEYWPEERVRQDILREVTPESSCWLAIHGSKVVGFCWGYAMKISDLEKKFDIPLDIPFSKDYAMALQDEVGILTSYRDKKIAKEMVKRRLYDFIAMGLEYGIVKTREKPEPSVTYLWYTKKLGFEVIAKYPEANGRVILMGNLNDVRKIL